MGCSSMKRVDGEKTGEGGGRLVEGGDRRYTKNHLWIFECKKSLQVLEEVGVCADQRLYNRHPGKLPLSVQGLQFSV